MPPSTPASRRTWLVRGAGAGAVGFFLLLVLRFWHPVYGFTSFLMMDRSAELPVIGAVRDEPVYLYPYPAAYDGKFYAQIAQHPLLDSRELGPAMDDLAYRARRILPSALAWLLAGGDPFWIFDAYSSLNILAWLALAWILWWLLDVRDARTWAAWAGVMFSAGAMISVRRALTDLVALAFIAGFLLLLRTGRRMGTVLALGAAGLCRETSMLAAAALPFGRGRSESGARRGSPGWAACLAMAAAPLAAWVAYVRLVAGPGMAGARNFTWPLAGLLGKWAATLSDSGAFSDPAVAASSYLALLAVTVQAVYLCVHRDARDPWWRMGAAYLLMMAVLGPAVWQGTPSAAYRVLLPLTLAFNLVAAGRRSSMLWILLGNLTVAQGLVSFRDLPSQDRLDLNAARNLTGAAIVREGPGWYGPEHSERHDWLWTPDRGRLSLEVWPRDRARVGLHVSLVSKVPRRAEVSQDGVVKWSGTIGPTATPITVSAAVSNGRADLDFSSDTPPVLGAPGGEFRRLTLAVYDPRVVLGQVPNPEP